MPTMVNHGDISLYATEAYFRILHGGPSQTAELTIKALTIFA